MQPCTVEVLHLYMYWVAASQRMRTGTGRACSRCGNRRPTTAAAIIVMRGSAVQLGCDELHARRGILLPYNAAVASYRVFFHAVQESVLIVLHNVIRLHLPYHYLPYHMS